jgi:hypothetical protein
MHYVHVEPSMERRARRYVLRVYLCGTCWLCPAPAREPGRGSGRDGGEEEGGEEEGGVGLVGRGRGRHRRKEARWGEWDGRCVSTRCER